jgi:hypothetical protein
MSQDLSLEPELLPPMPLAQAAPQPAKLGAAACGAVLVMLAGVCGFSVRLPEPALAAAPRPVVQVAAARLAVPAVLDDVAAGQPSVLSAPAGGAGGGDAYVTLASSGSAR